MAFDRGAALAPIDPGHYFTLAELYRRKGMNESASKHYVKFARSAPDSERADEALVLARRFDPKVAGIFDPPRLSRREMPAARCSARSKAISPARWIGPGGSEKAGGGTLFLDEIGHGAKKMRLQGHTLNETQ